MGDNDPPGLATRLCAVDGCGRKHYGRGLCKAHHARWRRTDNPGPAEITLHAARAAVCTVEGCDRPHQARGYCGTHYSRLMRTGDVHPAKPPNPRVCGVAGCQGRHYGRGMCRPHYQRWQQAGGGTLGLNITEAAQLYQDGAAARALGQLYGVTPRAVLAALRTAGVPVRSSRPRRRTNH